MFFVGVLAVGLLLMLYGTLALAALLLGRCAWLSAPYLRMHAAIERADARFEASTRGRS